MKTKTRSPKRTPSEKKNGERVTPTASAVAETAPAQKRHEVALVHDEGRHAFEQVSERCDALFEGECLVYNLDSTYVPSVVDAALVRCAPFEAVLETLPEFPKGLFARLPHEVNALVYTQAKLMEPEPEGDALPAQAKELETCRTRIILAVDMLRAFNKRAIDVAQKLRAPSGYYLEVAAAKMLTHLARQHWDLLPVHTMLTEGDLVETDRLAQDMTSALGAREKFEQGVSWVERRRRVATLLVRDYNELRFGMAYLRRHHGDAEQFAPMLYDNTRRGRPVSEKPADPSAPVADPKAAREEKSPQDEKKTPAKE